MNGVFSALIDGFCHHCPLPLILVAFIVVALVVAVVVAVLLRLV